VHDIALWIQTVLVPWLGAPGVFVTAFLDASFVSLPQINDLLVITTAALDGWDGALAALMAACGSTLGYSVVWRLGVGGGEALLARRFGPAKVTAVRQAYQRWDVYALVLPALLPPPVPCKLFVFAAGVFGVTYVRFALTLFLARLARYGLLAGLGHLYGEQALAALHQADAWFATHGLWLVAGLVALALTLAFAWRRRAATLLL
jgi:membrane protein YqaA with SNARE-associated domain